MQLIIFFYFEDVNIDENNQLFIKNAYETEYLIKDQKS